MRTCCFNAGRLLLSNQDSQGGPGKFEILAEAVFEQSQIVGRDVLRVADKEGEGRRLGGVLRDIRGQGRLAWAALADRQRMNHQQLLQKFVQLAG